MYKKVGSHARLGRYEEAIRYCDKALELDPRYILAWNNKSLVQDGLGHLMEAARSGTVQETHRMSSHAPARIGGYVTYSDQSAGLLKMAVITATNS